MSTNASLAVQLSDCTIKVVHLQLDGDIKHAGKLLNQFYSVQEDAETLVSGGAIYSLGMYYNPVEVTSRNKHKFDSHSKHSFETPADDVTVLYSRDRGDIVLYDLYESVGSYIASILDNPKNYHYLFLNGKWKVIDIQDLSYFFI